MEYVLCGVANNFCALHEHTALCVHFHALNLLACIEGFAHSAAQVVSLVLSLMPSVL